MRFISWKIPLDQVVYLDTWSWFLSDIVELVFVDKFVKLDNSEYMC